MPTEPRRTRKDALQNRERLLAVAAEAFAKEGPKVSPAAIAAAAGVGVGTLYRHFPTQEALIHAAYQRELAQVCARATELLGENSAADALQRWMGDVMDYASAKQGMSQALNTVIASGEDPYAESRALLTEAVGVLLRAGARDGTLRTDVSFDDVLLAISGIAQSTGAYGTREQADRLIRLLMDALTRGAAQPG